LYVRLSIGLLPLYSKSRTRLEPASWCEENVVSPIVVLLNWYVRRLVLFGHQYVPGGILIIAFFCFGTVLRTS
jgi:hypothetical protein